MVGVYIPQKWQRVQESNLPQMDLESISPPWHDPPYNIAIAKHIQPKLKNNMTPHAINANRLNVLSVMTYPFYAYLIHVLSTIWPS